VPIYGCRHEPAFDVAARWEFANAFLGDRFRGCCCCGGPTLYEVCPKCEPTAAEVDEAIADIFREL